MIIDKRSILAPDPGITKNVELTSIMIEFLLVLLIPHSYCKETADQRKAMDYTKRSPELYWKCTQNISSCTSHNYNNRFQVPVDYNIDHAPGNIVDLEVGLFYNALTFLGEFFDLGICGCNSDPASAIFGLNFLLHVRWNDSRLAWSAQELEVSGGLQKPQKPN